MPNPSEQFNDPISKQDRKMDLAAAITQLNPIDRRICLMLLKGYTKTEIARHFNLIPSTLFRRHIQKIKLTLSRHFMEISDRPYRRERQKKDKTQKVLPKGISKPTT